MENHHKKIVSILIIVLVVTGFGYFLFKTSGGVPTSGSVDFNLKDLKPTDKLREVQTDDHILGSPQAKNTMVAFEDIQCPACKNYEPILKSFATELKDTKVVFRHYPLPMHKNAGLAALASEAASSQGKFWEWVNLAYERQEKWSDLADPTEMFVEIAKDSGVKDLEKFRLDVNNKTFKARVEVDVREAVGLNVGGTPTLYFNGVKLELASLEGIKQQVEKILSSSK
jgi:protein-disulfide isomerase